MSSKWHGGKGDGRRKKADDRKYREGWDRIFGNIKKPMPINKKDS